MEEKIEIINNELKTYGLHVSSRSFKNGELVSVSTNEFPQKENKQTIKDLTEKGWFKKYGGRHIGGVLHICLSKNL